MRFVMACGLAVAIGCGGTEGGGLLDGGDGGDPCEGVECGRDEVCCPSTTLAGVTRGRCILDLCTNPETGEPMCNPEIYGCDVCRWQSGVSMCTCLADPDLILGPEVCGDLIDNDCNGQTDEGESSEDGTRLIPCDELE